MRIVVVGVGGIGSHLCMPLAQFLAFYDAPCELVLIDGDSFESSNKKRQIFEKIGPKAEVMAATLRRLHPSLSVESIREFLTPENIEFYIDERDIVSVCVDNHATRKVVSEHAATLNNVCIISGGNELTEGDVLVYLRREGVDATPPLTSFSEIAHPKALAPYEMGCEERAKKGAPQIVWMNYAVASAMGNALWRYLSERDTFVSHTSGKGKFARQTAYAHVRLDIFENRSEPIPNPTTTP